MKIQLDPETRQLLELVHSSAPETLPVHLVGGAVRDLVLGRPVNDFDFVVPTQSLELAKKVRHQLHAVGFTLDDERQTGRVILNQGKPNEIILDFVIYTGGSLFEDAKNRDFTINTLLLDLKQPEEVIDLLGGLADLDAKVLKAASACSMQLDPLRVLRGIRFKRTFNLEIELQTESLMREAAVSLAQVSGERIRDELFKILAQSDIAEAFRLIDRLGALAPVFPELAAIRLQPAIYPHVHPLWEHTLQVITYLEVLLGSLANPVGGNTAIYMQPAKEMLAQYAEQVQDLLSQPIQAGRPRRSLLMLAALYHDVGKPLTQTQDEKGRFHFYGHDKAGSELMEKRARALMLGKEEVGYLSLLVSQHMRIHHFSKPGIELTDRAVYRYFRDLGAAGVDNALLSLADTLAAVEDTLPMEAWKREVDAVGKLLAAWFNRQEALIQPPKLLDGQDLQRIFGLEPSPLLGEILAALRETQAAGEVRDEKGAIDFVYQFLESKKQEGEPHED
ncbi:MAG TPA: HD domain-containing protein [Anaerolineaceae bacterium]|nr:HD domain-containing protein [Anaerolineaceae bacterium]